MSVLGICQVAFQHKKLGISKEALAGRVLPFLLPVSIDQSLNLHQFNLFMALIHEMLSRLETEHRAKLEQLASLHAEQRTLMPGNSKSDVGTSQASPSRGAGASAQNGGFLGGLMDSLLSDFGLLGFGSTNGPASGNSGAAKPSADSKSDTTGDFQPFFTVPSSGGSSPSKVTAANLSLEEKLRLSNQKEELERIQKETQGTPAPKPTLAAASRNPPKPKDLSNTLPQSQPAAPQIPSNGGSSHNVAAQRAINASLSANLSGLGVTAPSSVRPPAVDNSSLNITPSWPSAAYGGNQPMMPVNASVSSTQPAKTQQQRANVDLSAFDSLVAMPQAKTTGLSQPIAAPRMATPNNTAMNVMQPQMQPQASGFSGGFGIASRPTAPMGAPLAGMMNAQVGMTMAMPMIRPPVMNPTGLSTPTAPSNPSSQALSKKDIDDLLG